MFPGNLSHFRKKFVKTVGAMIKKKYEEEETCTCTQFIVDRYVADKARVAVGTLIF